MTYGKRQFENLDGVMRRLIPPFHQAMNELLLMVDADSTAFNSYMVRTRHGDTPRGHATGTRHGDMPRGHATITPALMSRSDALCVDKVCLSVPGGAEDGEDDERGSSKV